MWQNVLESVLIAVITTVISIAAGYLVSFLKKKAAEAECKCKDETRKNLVNTGCDILVNLVNATSQTIVSDLKKEGKFDTDAAKKVFEDVKQAAKDQMTVDVKNAIEMTYNATIDEFLETKIESIIAEGKNKNN